MFKIAILVSFLTAIAYVVGQNFLQCNNPLFAVDCDSDCKEQHKGVSGACNLNDVCLCHKTGDNLDGSGGATALINITDIPIKQCDKNFPLIGFAYQAFCNFDCCCQHGAASGTCDFDLERCDCNYDSGATFENVENSNCPKCITSSFLQALRDLGNSGGAGNLIILAANGLISFLSATCS